MALSNRIVTDFQQEPGATFAFVETAIYGRTRRIPQILFGLLEAIDGSIANDPATARTNAFRAFTLVHLALTTSGPGRQRTFPEAPAFTGLAYAVLGSTYMGLNDDQHALRIFASTGRLDLPPEILGTIAARRARAYMRLREWPNATRCANEAVTLYSNVDKAISPLTPYNSLQMALTVRARVLGTRYFFDPTTPPRILDYVETDANRTLILTATKPKMKPLRVMAVNALAFVASSRAYAGQPFHHNPAWIQQLRSIPPRSPLSPKALWMQATLAAHSEGLTYSARSAFRKAQHLFLERHRYDEAIQVTIDLQWWLIATGSARQAALENRLILEQLHHLTENTDIIRAWSHGVETRALTSQVVDQVFRHIRGIRGALPPI